MRKFINQSNFDPKTIKGEFNSMPSQTIPNQTMSLQDLVDKFTVTAQWPKEPIPEQFDSFQNLELPDISKMDKIEQAQLAIDISQNISETQLELKQIQSELKLKQTLAKETKENMKNQQEEPPETT